MNLNSPSPSVLFYTSKRRHLPKNLKFSFNLSSNWAKICSEKNKDLSEYFAAAAFGYIEKAPILILCYNETQK